jgi:hypothetical protein
MLAAPPFVHPANMLLSLVYSLFTTSSARSWLQSLLSGITAT